MVRQLAEIHHLKGCFGVRPRRPPTLDVLTHASAAQAVQGGVPAVVWLDKHAEAIMLTERWADTVYTQRLPLQLEVVHLPQPFHRTPEEDVVATITFSNRASVELFVKLGQHVLPEWLAFRQGALGRNLLSDSGFWLISYYGRALQLRSTDGSFTGLMQLNLHKPAVELIIHNRNQCIRSRAVNSLHMAAEMLHKEAPKQRLQKDVQRLVQSLQPSLPLLERLRGQLKASAKQARGAASMGCYMDVGIIAALMDCAAAQLSDKQQLELYGHKDCVGSSNAELSIIQTITKCICLVLWNAGERAHEQAQLLVSCAARCLSGTCAQASRAALLLATLLKQAQDDNDLRWQPLKQAIQDAALLRQLLHCYNSTTQATVQELMLQSGCLGTDGGPQSHPLAAHLDAIQFDVPLSQLPSSSTAGAQPARHVVPRLPLPGLAPVTPPVNSRSSRLGQWAPSEQHSPVCQPSSAGAPQARSSRSMSRLALLQHLGHSCGENAMAADLAAFVTHKQQHASQAVDGIQQKWGQLQEGAAAAETVATPKQLTLGQLNQLPADMQLQLRSLECISLLVNQLPAGYPLPPSLGCVMVQQLLSMLLAKHCQELQQVVQHTPQLVEQGTEWLRHVALQVLALSAGGNQAVHTEQHFGNSFSMLSPVHSSILAQFQDQLKELCTSKRPSARVHLACRDTLLLLSDYVRLSSTATLTETACSVLGHALGQLEHMLRASRVSLWGWPAVQHMDALVQVYTCLAEQATTPTAARHLLQVLCPQQAGITPRSSGARAAGSSSGGGSASTPSAAGATLAWVPAGTLQLVLELLQHATQCIDTMDSPAACDGPHQTPFRQSTAGSSVGSYVAGRPSAAVPAARMSGARKSNVEHQLMQMQDAVGQGGSQASAGPVAAEVIAVKVHCWKLLEAVLKLAERYQSSKLTGAGSLTSSSFGGYELSSLDYCSSTGSEWLPKPRFSAASGKQVVNCAQGDSSGGQADQPLISVTNRQKSSIASGRGSESDLQSSQRQLSSHRLTGLQDLELADGATSAVDVAAVLTNAMRNSDSSSEQRAVSLRGVPLRLANSMAFAFAPCSPVAAPPSVSSISTTTTSNGSEVVRILVDQLMRQRGSRPLVIHLLEEMDGSQAALPLQLQILNFISAAYDVPGAYPVKVPQLAEFYVHYHFLHFTRHYYKLLTCPNLTALSCCKGHVKVLLALCRHTGGANVIRRRFLQLKVLEFVIRELSVEHNMLGRQFTCGASSVCSTPLSSARMPTSSRHSTAGLTGCTAKQLSSGNTAAVGAGNGGLHSADEALTHRGLSGLLVSSFSGPRSADSCQGQPAHTAVASLQQQGTKQVPTLTAASQGHCPANSTSAMSAADQGRQSVGSNLVAKGSPYKNGAVLSAVKKFEAAATATGPVTGASSSIGAKHCRPGSSRLIPAAGGAQAAKCSSGADSAAHNPIVAVRKEIIWKPHPPQQPRSDSSLAAEQASKPLLPAEDGQVPALDATGGLQQLTETEAPATAALRPASSAASSSLCTRRPVAAEQSKSACVLGEQQPQLTGDASYDGQLIEEWEERTGLEFVFDCLSSEQEDEGQSSDEQEYEDQQLYGSPCHGASFDPSLGDSPRQCAQPRPTTLLRAVPRLALGGPAPLERQHSSLSTESDCSYKPGFDLEEDFMRLMSAEEAGRQGSWDFSQDGGSSDDSSLIAAGRDSSEQEQQSHSPSESPRGHSSGSQEPESPVADYQPYSCNKQAIANGSDVLSSPGDAGIRQRLAPKAMAMQLSRTAMIQQQQSAPDAGQDIVADAGEDSASLCEDSYFDRAAGLQEEPGEEQSAEAIHTPTGACGFTGAPSPYRRGIVPQLRLPSDQHSLQQQGYTAAVPSSARSAASGISSCSTGRHAVPSIMSAATPLLTTRMDGHVAYSSSHGNAVGIGRGLSQCDGRLPVVAEPQAVMSASVYQAQRHMHAVYADNELHVMCLELALHLLGTPAGSLDPLQLPQEPTDTSLQQKVLILLAHLSHRDNTSVLFTLMERVCKQVQLKNGLQAASGTAAADSASSSPRRSSEAAAGTCSSGSAAQSATNGLAGCAHRLLKLLSPLLLNLEKIQLGGTIQQGAFSEVKTGTLLRADAPQAVAVKVLDSATNDATCFERVYNEVAILEQLRGHTGVVPLLEYGVIAGSSGGGSNSTVGSQPQWLLVFPRYNTSLRAWRHSRRSDLQPGDIALYLRIFVQVASIVRDLHAANIVHYDIKGDNLLLDTSGSSNSGIPFNVVLADFGDACMFDSNISTSVQRHRGTELFSSPEMLLLHAGQHHPGHEQHDRRKHRGVGPAHDVWSLGCMLYELITGRVLFEEEGVGRITSYAPSSSAGGVSAHSKERTGSAAGAGCSGGVLRSNECAALGGHAGVIELVECMLAGDASWRPGAAEVVYKAERLLAAF